MKNSKGYFKIYLSDGYDYEGFIKSFIVYDIEESVKNRVDELNKEKEENLPRYIHLQEKSEKGCDFTEADLDFYINFDKDSTWYYSFFEIANLEDIK